MKTVVAAVLGFLFFNASAQSGYYEALRYRANDPFLFCTKGQVNRDKCWAPVAPYLGQYIMLPHCDPPNPKGKPWTHADKDSLSQYLRICPRAMSSGRWEGKEGSPERVPFSH